MKKGISLLLTLALLCACLSGCGKEQESSVPDATTGATATNPVETTTPSVEIERPEELFTNRDERTDWGEDSVFIDLGTVSEKLTLTEEGTYVLSGTLEGMIVVDAPKTAKLQLVLNNATVHSEASAALYIRSADKVFVTLPASSENSLQSDGFTPIDENNIDGAVFSKEDLTFNGTGSLTVTSAAGHGIVCKDDLVMTGGSYQITASGHGLEANDSIRLKNAALSIKAGMDGIHGENEDDASLGFVYLESGKVTIEAEGDGISAGSWLEMAGGTVDVCAGGGSENGTKASSGSFGGFPGGRPGGQWPGSSVTTEEDGTSMKGLKAGLELVISGGSITVNAADDAIHSNTAVTISGGTLELASGDDGIHGDETVTISAGSIHITESYEGIEALSVNIQGGDIRLTATDDGINAAGGTDASGSGGRDGMFGGPGGFGRPGMGGGTSSNGTIVISGGNLYVKASGDGIDANGTLTISGGNIVVTGPVQGDTSTLDYDVSGVITGGTFIGTGSSSMAQTFSDSTQGVLAVSVGSQNAGTEITVTDKDGKVVLTHEPELPFNVIIFSSPELVSGETYTLHVGTISGDITAK